MGYFPLFIDLEQKDCLVVGGGEVAFRRAKILSEFGANVTVIAPEFSDEFLNSESGNQIKREKRIFQSGDLYGRDLVVAATDRADLNKQIGQLCEEEGILFNAANIRTEKSFLFPACVKRSPVVIGITTGGKSPALAKEIRKRIEGMVDEAYGNAAVYLGEMREEIKTSGLNKEQKKELFHRIAEEVLRAEER